MTHRSNRIVYSQFKVYHYLHPSSVAWCRISRHSPGRRQEQHFSTFSARHRATGSHDPDNRFSKKEDRETRPDYRSISSNFSLGMFVWLEMSLRRVFRVFALISLCRGTVTGLTPVSHCFPIRTWLPVCRRKEYPIDSSILITLYPLTTGCFGNNINLVLKLDNRHIRGWLS